MSSTAEYLESLQRKGITLWVDNGQLHYRANEGGLDPQERAQLRLLKDSIVAELTKSPDRAQLTFQQRWLMQQQRNDPRWSCALRYAFRLRGKLRRELLERAVETLLLRYEILRTRIDAADDSLHANRVEPGTYRLNVTPVSGASQAGTQSDILLMIREIATRRLGCSRTGPLLEAQLVQTSEDDHFLVLAIHRLAADCLSAGHIVRELWLLYEDACGKTESPFEQPSTYRDYAVWQRETADSWHQRHAPYWQKRLVDAVCIQWPVAGPPLSGRSAFDSSRCSFGEPLSTQLREAGRQARTLTAMVALTLFTTVISRLCNQLDFVLPVNIAGRHSEHDDVIGTFAHVLYLRMQMTGSETFTELLRRVSNEFYRAVSHQDFGRAVTSKPSLLGGTLFQWQSSPPDAIPGETAAELPCHSGLTVENVQFQRPEDLTTLPPSLADIEISFFDSTQGIGMSLIYRADRFTAETLERLIAELQLTAARVAESPAALSA